MLVRIFFFVLAIAAALTHGYRFRQKRVSDQRLAELETIIALSTMKGDIKTIPYGFGSVDPRKIGRKRRSSPGVRSPGVLFDRLMESIASEDEEDTSQQERPVIQWPPYFWSDQESE